MKRRKSRRIHLLLVGAGTLVPLLGVGVATASFMPGGIGDEVQQWVLSNYLNPLAQIEEQLTKVDPIMETMMKVALGGSWNEMKSTTGSNPPNPYEVRTTETGISPGVLTTNSIVSKRDIANLYDQELGRSMAAPMLGETGRNFIKKEAEQTSKIVENNQQGLQEAQKLAQQAKSLTVTQDVMKNNAEITSALAGIVTNQSRLTADSHTALLQLQQLDGAIVQLAANTSEGIDESNRRDRVTRQLELGSATRTEIYIPGLYSTHSSQKTK